MENIGDKQQVASDIGKMRKEWPLWFKVGMGFLLFDSFFIIVDHALFLKPIGTVIFMIINFPTTTLLIYAGLDFGTSTDIFGIYVLAGLVQYFVLGAFMGFIIQKMKARKSV
ncbi:MAG: hypothetical protein COU08_01500 [Candidatus Harrisonbacteria bacterium CG10_big_fil_rev_8_21_14_0_10_42_17]|uniref:Uncharacterized protein n=1 Tax=Candidatus Harrisonbacteria bacterium CG10_big_fil_rev_8_21_14_0_10_42_17 TaxID=1974584 RepID=A0A2M6WIR8_9BACT|nr:MAG: hypothetical protein COU08_01500 [Candidatus Harrisonbacteria bacterium CG10_big_fil_rev_8_21_14_0_10_42_17]